MTGVIAQPHLRTIRLFGALGRKFGRVHKFSVRTPAEAVRALCANFPTFEKELRESKDKNVAYRVKVDSREIDETELSHPSSREIHFQPIIMGSGATGKIIVGAVLIVAALVIGVGSGGTAGFIAGVMLNAGIGLMIGGIYQMLVPVPKADEPEEDPANKPSYVFNGPVNTTAQGHPVPVGYGRLIVGGAVISAGIQIDDTSVTNPVVDPSTDRVDFTAKCVSGVVTGHKKNHGLTSGLTINLFGFTDPAKDLGGVVVTVIDQDNFTFNAPGATDENPCGGAPQFEYIIWVGK